MIPIFVVCAAVGATALVLQFILSLTGLGGEHDFGHDFGGLDHDVAGGDVHGDVSHAGSHHSGAAHSTLATSWLIRALTLRTVSTALAFFGLAGLAGHAADFSPEMTLLIALAAGFGSMYAVYWMFNGLKSLRAEGTAKIHRAIGKEATVYLHIPGNRQGRGKIQINLQNRTMEYLAMTDGAAIPTGATVVVTEVLGSDLVQVETMSSKTTHEAIPTHSASEGLR
jgi:hypothetical protein